jgi:Protein of unknown function, DUF600
MDDPAVYQRIASILSSSIPEAWKIATARIEIGNQRSQVVTSYQSVDGKLLHLPLDRELSRELDSIVYKLHEEMSAVRKDKAKWYTFEFTLEPSGKFSIDFSYNKILWVFRLLLARVGWV